MTFPQEPVRRRDLTRLLAIPGAALATQATACSGPSPVPTSSDIARDPLAELDPENWDARTAEEVLALPVHTPDPAPSQWDELGTDDAALDPARAALVDFVREAYLSPSALRGLDDDAALEHIITATPEYWVEDLETAWNDGGRHFYAFSPAERYRTVGRPAIAADWFRGEREDLPVLMLGSTVAWTVLDTDSHAVGVIAYRLGIVATIESDGSASEATLRVTVHGLDGCATTDEGGLPVPALADSEEHQAAQKATMDNVIASPRIPRDALLDDHSALFEGRSSTNVVCE
ncbi:hypothetical protein ACFQS2_02295 [Brachybacterium sp. GCM10030267]|uniref:hypothetical protein n=1 Tax=unclassified Brachybacterium TaxID=2623841 RepID=UPI003610F134